MNLYQHAKNQAISSFFSRDTFDLKVLLPNWPKAFWPISQELDFSKKWALFNDQNFKGIRIQKNPTFSAFLREYFFFFKRSGCHAHPLKYNEAIPRNFIGPFRPWP